ncbi:twitching motility protein PilT [Candidatus Magnetomorum sp. HK-1]|nr:twitching motility protein PilT [Candidatus Magnetomorum sp. HK-1]
MKKYQVIIDTNVIVSAFRSKKGASHLLVKLLRDQDTRWEANISTALILEYESVLKREMHVQQKSFQMVDDLIDDIGAGKGSHLNY